MFVEKVFITNLIVDIRASAFNLFLRNEVFILNWYWSFRRMAKSILIDVFFKCFLATLTRSSYLNFTPY